MVHTWNFMEMKIQSWLSKEQCDSDYPWQALAAKLFKFLIMVSVTVCLYLKFPEIKHLARYFCATIILAILRAEICCLRQPEQNVLEV
jgi:hypothetical protein